MPGEATLEGPIEEPRLDGPRLDIPRLDKPVSVDTGFDEDETMVESMSDEPKELPDRTAEDAEASDPVADATRLVDDAALLLWTVELELVEFDGEY